MVEPSPLEAASDAFAEEARSAGLVVPPPRKFGAEQAVVALGISVLVLAAALGVGYAAGWLNPARSSSSGPVLAGPQDCGANGSAVPLVLADEPNASTGLDAAWAALADPFANLTGSCLSVEMHATGLDGLASLSVAGTIGPSIPEAGSLANLSSETYSVPLLASPLVVLYHLGGTTASLNLTADALAGIYLGTVRAWNDPSLTAWNPGLASDLPVTPFHLAGPSVANDLLSSYLSEENASFRTAVGSGVSPAWPVGPSASSPAEMLSQVAAMPGAIGYEPSNVCPSLPRSVGCAGLGSASASFTPATVASVLAALNSTSASTAAVGADWANVTGVTYGDPGAYPMVELTYASVYRDVAKAYGALLSPIQAKWLLTLLWWVASLETTTWATEHVVPSVLSDGYVPVPTSMEGMAQNTLALVTYNGTSILFPNGEEGGESGNDTGEF